MGVDSNVGVGVATSLEMTAGLDEGRGCGITGKGEDSVKVGWQAEVKRDARIVIHKRRVINFMSVSFS
jgi:hypothetical protein